MITDRLASQITERFPVRPGLGGFLIIPSIGLVVALVVGLWDQYLTSVLWIEKVQLLFGGAGKHTGNPLIAVGLLTYKTICYGLLVWTAVLYFQCHRYAPMFLAITAIYTAVYYVAQGEAGASYADVAARLLVLQWPSWSVLLLIPLVNYFRRSERVKVTFVRGRKESTEQEIRGGELAVASPEAPPIGGWLLMPAVGLIAVPVAGLVCVTFFIASPEAPSGTMHSLILAIQAMLYLAMLCVAVPFYMRKRIAPRLVIWSMGVLVLLHVMALVLYEGSGPALFAQYSKVALLFSFMIIPIWIPYFKQARRVKKTFVNGGGERILEEIVALLRDARESSFGVSGWLLTPAVALLTVPIAGLFRVWYTSSAFREMHGAAYDGALLLHGVLDGTFYLAMAVIAALFFMKKRAVPRLLVALMVVFVASNALQWGLFSSVGPEFLAETCRLTALAAVAVAGIWIPYFLRSKRVKETFVK